MRKLLILLLLCCEPLFCQVVQYGKVVEMDDLGKPLAGVTLTIESEYDCQPTMSDAHGQFRICFKKHQVGDVVHGIEAKKRGYDVVNVHVTRSWTLTDADTLGIIMAPKKKIKEARSRYYGVSLASPEALLWMLEGDRMFEVESSDFCFHIQRYGDGIIPSDVDRDIPVVEENNEKLFAVVIANEDYEQDQDVPFAVHDGEVFGRYCNQVLGIPEKNIHVITNATLNNIRFEVDWLRNQLEAYRGEAKGIFYYAGHGIPDETSRNAYLLPVDGYADNLESSYSIDALYSYLGSADSDVMMYFIDACFSGTTREGEMMAESRGVAVNTKEGVLQGAAVAFSAAQGNEAAYAYTEKSHGLFTYFLLKKLKETRGDITAGELADYLDEQVTRVSAEDRPKSQHPKVTSTMSDWRTIKLR